MFKAAVYVIGTWLLVLFGCLLVLNATSIAPGIGLVLSVVVASVIAGKIAHSFDGEL